MVEFWVRCVICDASLLAGSEPAVVDWTSFGGPVCADAVECVREWALAEVE